MDIWKISSAEKIASQPKPQDWPHLVFKNSRDAGVATARHQVGKQ